MQALVDKGALTAEEARGHPRRSLITQAVQGQPYRASTATIPVEPGDRVLLCSDGLSDYVDDAEIDAVMRVAPDPETCARDLVERALAAHTNDNVTAVVADVVQAGRRRPDRRRHVDHGSTPAAARGASSASRAAGAPPRSVGASRDRLGWGQRLTRRPVHHHWVGQGLTRHPAHRAAGDSPRAAATAAAHVRLIWRCRTSTRSRPGRPRCSRADLAGVVRLVQDPHPGRPRTGAVRVGILDDHVDPAVPDVRPVQFRRVVELDRHQPLAVGDRGELDPPVLAALVHDPLEPESGLELVERRLDVAVGETRIDVHPCKLSAEHLLGVPVREHPPGSSRSRTARNSSHRGYAGRSEAASR